MFVRQFIISTLAVAALAAADEPPQQGPATLGGIQMDSISAYPSSWSWHMFEPSGSEGVAYQMQLSALRFKMVKKQIRILEDLDGDGDKEYHMVNRWFPADEDDPERSVTWKAQSADGSLAVTEGGDGTVTFSAIATAEDGSTINCAG